jgi:hypothetical protein
MDLRTTHPSPLHAPAYLIRDAALADARRQRRSPGGEMDSLLRQYDGACGYATPQGQIIESMELRSATERELLFQIVPLGIWEDSEPERRQVSWSIAEWLDHVRASVQAQLSGLPLGLYLNGGRRGGARVSHEVFSFYCLDTAREQTAREWLFAEFVPREWPRLTALMRRTIRYTVAISGNLDGPPPRAAHHAGQRPRTFELRVVG